MERCLSPAGLLHPLSAAHSFCDPRTPSSICREARSFILGTMGLVIGGTLGPCYPQVHRRLCQALDEVLGCFAVSHCLSGTAAEPWHFSQGREDAPVPLPTCLRYGEGRIYSAHHWCQILLLLSLPGEAPRLPGPQQLALLCCCPPSCPRDVPVHASIHPSCSCLMPL